MLKDLLTGKCNEVFEKGHKHDRKTEIESGRSGRFVGHLVSSDLVYEDTDFLRLSSKRETNSRIAKTLF